MAYTPEILEDQETEKDWKVESERLMNMVGWGDDDGKFSGYFIGAATNGLERRR